MRYLYVALFILFIVSAPGQSIDSLKRLIATQSPAEQMKTFNEMADLLLNSNAEESHKYTNKSLDIALRLKNRKGQEDAYINLGWYYMNVTKHDSAKYFLLKALETGKKNDDSPARLNAMTGLSNALSELMQYDTAIIVLNEALGIARGANATAHLANIYAVLGNVYNTMGQSDTALALYYKAKTHYQEAGNQSDMAVMLNNMATILIKSGKYATALDLLHKATELNTVANNVSALLMNSSNAAICYRKTGAPEKAKTALLDNIALAKANKLNFQLAINYNAMGNTLDQMGDVDQARTYFDSSLMISRMEGIDYGILVNHTDLGFMFQKSGNPDSARVYFQKAYSQIKTYGLKQEESKIAFGLYESYKTLGVYDSALHYYEKSAALTDSLRTVDVNQKLVELEGKYQQEKNLKRIAELNESNYRERADHRLVLILVISVFSLVVVYLVYKRYKNRNELLKAKVTEKEKEKLEIEYQSQQKVLTVNAMHLARMNELSYGVGEHLKKLLLTASDENMEEIKALISHLSHAAPDVAWKEFEARFEQVHQEFYHALNQLHPGLTPTEIKICSFIRLNMTSKDIALLTNRSLRTIESTRNNIRKKLLIAPDASLTKYLLSL